MESNTDIQAKVEELSTEALIAFCDDISGMFDVEMECTGQESVTETATGLKKRFKKLTAINTIKAKGALNNNFHVIFDQGGLFTLSGVVVMLPENRIKEEIKRGSEKEAEHMSDAFSELGNMMVGTLDRIFREELADHEHFVQTNTFIGKPWDNPEEVLGIDSDEEFTYIPYEMTVGSYPSFKCGVIFPNAVFEPEVEDEPEAEEVEEAAVDEAVEESVAQAEGEEVVEESESVSEGDAAQAEGVAEESVEATDSESEPEGAEEAEEDVEESASVEPEEESKEFPERPVSRAIQEMTSGTRSGISLAVTAGEIMQTDVVWIEPDDTVGHAVDKMQQNEVGYLLVGKEGVLDGIVSRSDLAGAISPYLRPVFAKWKRPLDDATLQIKISWIMTKPVRTITPHTMLDIIVDTMLHFGGRCLPVVDQDGKVHGMVTVFDVFKVLSSSGDVGQSGKTPQMPAVV